VQIELASLQIRCQRLRDNARQDGALLVASEVAAKQLQLNGASLGVGIPMEGEQNTFHEDVTLAVHRLHQALITEARERVGKARYLNWIGHLDQSPGAKTTG